MTRISPGNPDFPAASPRQSSRELPETPCRESHSLCKMQCRFLPQSRTRREKRLQEIRWLFRPR
jgi:hypothetical protein